MDVAQVNDTQATSIFLWSWQELDLPSEVLNYAPKMISVIEFDSCFQIT